MVQKKKSDEQDVLVVRDEKTGEISVVAGGPGVSVLHGPSHDSALDGVHVCERFEDMARVLAGLDAVQRVERGPRAISGS